MTFYGTEQVEIIQTSPNFTQIDTGKGPVWVRHSELSDSPRAAKSKSGSVKTGNDRDMVYHTDDARASRPWVAAWSESVAWIVGFLAMNNAHLRHSGQRQQNLTVETESFEEAELAHGEKFDVVVRNPNYPGLDDLLDINFIQRGNTSRVSLNKQEFFKFLLGLGFRDGRGQQQDAPSIACRVPEEYQESFNMGIRGLIPQS
jgi:hypothetical protein